MQQQQQTAYCETASIHIMRYKNYNSKQFHSYGRSLIHINAVIFTYKGLRACCLLPSKKISDFLHVCIYKVLYVIHFFAHKILFSISHIKLSLFIFVVYFSIICVCVLLDEWTFCTCTLFVCLLMVCIYQLLKQNKRVH